MKTKTLRWLKGFLVATMMAPAVALATGPELTLDRAPDRAGNLPALQNGAKIFVAYCLNCHSASVMRYNRLRDLGLTEQQIKENLLYTAEKVGELMKVAATPADQKKWFGAAPPDLSVIARARASEFGSGADWLYTYLRTFYRDPSRPNGWNNVVFENVGMPHVLWQLQGEQVLRVEKAKDSHGQDVERKKLELVKPGKLSQAEYDGMVADLVGYLVYMGEPVAETRKRLGVAVLVFLAVFGVLAYLLKREYWKDIH